eukprot:4681584-Pyramimonas_sp.AAC.1
MFPQPLFLIFLLPPTRRAPFSSPCPPCLPPRPCHHLIPSHALICPTAHPSILSSLREEERGGRKGAEIVG